MKTLILYANYSGTSSYFDDWCDSFSADVDIDATTIDICRVNKGEFARNIKHYELIILLHSTNTGSLSYINKISDTLLDRRGRLVVFAGNEVNIPGISMKERISFFKKITPDVICTQLLEETGRWLYDTCENSKVISIPHALNPSSFTSGAVHSKRKINSGVRSYKYSVHIGDEERTNFFKIMNSEFEKRSLRADFSFDPTKRFSRYKWAEFLQSCKTTLATEAGSYFLEKDDRLVKIIQEYILKNTKKKVNFMVRQNSNIFNLYGMLPRQIKDLIKFLYYKTSRKLNIKYENLLSDEVFFSEIYENLLKNYEKCPYYSKAISSRHFDAIGTKTGLVLLEGRYNDILLPGEHYIEIKKDFSNLDESFEYIMDEKYTQNIANKVFEYTMENHLHAHRIQKIKQQLFLV